MDDAEERIVAYALLTRDDVVRLGPSLRRVYPLAQDAAFDDLLKSLDAVDHPRGTISTNSC